MGKKNLTKSNQQKEALEEYYAMSKGEWSREELEAIADETGLTRQQVYKWLWDKKKIEKKVAKQEKLQKMNDSIEMHEFYCNHFCIRAPRTLRQAKQFRVDPSTSMWAIEIFKKEGWQLILQNGHQDSSLSQRQSEMAIQNTANQRYQLMKKMKESQLIEFDDQHIYKSSPFDVVPEGFEDHYPFLNTKKNPDHELKEELLDQDNLSCRSFKRYMQGKEREKSELKEKFATIHFKFDGGRSDKGSSDEIFEEKL